ncbi:hypothetical protein B296_00046577 [Ensete ventricosum]|uniref:thioredoxin-dependent peroxiredoxin n=1 Tax=Ensete ventricosum TaxID=4639 RepID=A0A426XL51_ENSVE|nr:hypothetical protein B296_00046577 [Ensete ventricosum]
MGSNLEQVHRYPPRLPFDVSCDSGSLLKAQPPPLSLWSLILAKSERSKSSEGKEARRGDTSSSVAMASCYVASVVSSKAATPMASLASPPYPPSKTLAIPKGFVGLRAGRTFSARSPRLASAPRSSSRGFTVKASSEFSHLAWVQTDRKSGGLGDLKYPLISDVTKSISKSYRVLIPDQALQYVQENPDEVCPAGWKPGEKSMKPDPKLSKEYFAAI